MPPALCFTSKRPAGTGRARAHLLAHGAHLARAARRRRAAVSTARRVASKRGRHAGAAGGEARARQRLVFPGPRGVAAAAALVGLEAGHRRHQQPRVAVGPQGGVDVEQLAGRRAQRQPGDELAHEGAIDLLRAVLVGLVAVVVEEDDVEVAAVAQLLAAELAVGDDGQAAVVAVALAQARPGPAQHGFEHRVGQRRQVVGHLLDA
jgi:hypothetical protein